MATARSTTSEQLTLPVTVPGGRQKPRRERRPARYSYRRGRDVEYMAMRKLKRLGYPTVQRSAGSHGPMDLTAFGPVDVLLVAVKGDRARPTPSEIREALDRLASVVTPEGMPVRRECWWWEGRRWHRHADA